MLNNVIEMFYTDLSSSCLLKQLAALQTKFALVFELRSIWYNYVYKFQLVTDSVLIIM